jgi:hypothetical protein
LDPKAQGLATPEWAAQNYQRQDQIEVQWKSQSFSFLLYQQQRGQSLDMLALSSQDSSYLSSVLMVKR